MLARGELPFQSGLRFVTQVYIPCKTATNPDINHRKYSGPFKNKP